MPVEQGYEQQLAPRAGAPMPMANAQAFGAGAGDALAQAGQQLHADRLRAYKIEQDRKADSELADFNHKFSLHRQTMDRLAAQMRSVAEPGAPGYAKTMTKADAAAREQLMAGLTSERVRRAATGLWDEYSTRLANVEGDYEEAQRVAKVTGDWHQANTIAANRIRRGEGGADAYADELKIGLASIDALQVAPDVKDKLRQSMEQDYGIAFVQHMMDTNPVAAKGLLDSGAFDHLDPKVVEALRNGSDVGIKRLETEARMAREDQARQQREAQRAALDNLQALDTLMKNGEVPDATQIAGRVAEAKAAGVSENDLIPYAFLAEKAGRVAYWRDKPTRALDERLSQLQGLAGAGKLDDRGQREMAQLQDVIKARGESEADLIGPLLKGGAEQRIEGIAKLAAMPRAERNRVAIEAGDDKARIIATIPSGRDRVLAVQGAAKRQAREYDFLPPKSEEVTDPKAELDRQFKAVLGAGLVADVGGDYQHLKDAALDVMAGRGNGWNAREFGLAVQTVAGMTRRSDGTPQGGIGPVNGVMTALPPLWNQREFEMRYFRYGFDGAVYGNGQPARAADIRAHYRLKFIGESPEGDAWYNLIDGQGRPLRRRMPDGSMLDYVLPVPGKPG